MSPPAVVSAASAAAAAPLLLPVGGSTVSCSGPIHVTGFGPLDVATDFSYGHSSEGVGSAREASPGRGGGQIGTFLSVARPRAEELVAKAKAEAAQREIPAVQTTAVATAEARAEAMHREMLAEAAAVEIGWPPLADGASTSSTLATGGTMGAPAVAPSSPPRGTGVPGFAEPRKCDSDRHISLNASAQACRSSGAASGSPGVGMQVPAGLWGRVRGQRNGAGGTDESHARLHV